MGYLTSINYKILINVSASGIFHAERGLRQGFPLSSLLFLLIMEGFRKLIKKGKEEGSLAGV